MIPRLLGILFAVFVWGFYLFVGFEAGNQFIIANKSTLSSEAQLEWEEDIRQLTLQMEQIHPNLFFATSKTAFDDAVDYLISRLPALPEDQVIVELMRLVALINDGHTWMLPSQEALGFRIFPLRIYEFAEGHFVTDAMVDYESSIGAQLIQIGNIQIDKIVELLAPLVSGDNSATVKERLPQYILTPEILFALGIVDDQETAIFRFIDRDGVSFELEISPVDYASYSKFLDPVPTFSEIFPMMLPQNEALHFLSNLESNFWVAELENVNTLYIQYNAVQSTSINGGSTISLTTFSNEVALLLDDVDFDKIIIDLRHNLGGNINTFTPLLSLLANHESLQFEDKLYVLIGRRTFSAAGVFADRLRTNPLVTLVGEPSGAGLNFYADNQGVVLSNSRIEVRVSTREFNTLREDDRPWHEPDIRIDLNSDDYFAGLDGALNRILELD